MLKALTLLLISLTTLLLMNTAHTMEEGSNFRAPAVSQAEVDRSPAVIGVIELI